MQMIEEETATLTAAQGGPGMYAVFGHPIAHSLSPRIHAAFARQLSIPLDYRPIEASAEEFVGALADFADRGGRGANVTLPLKQHAARLCLSISAPTASTPSCVAARAGTARAPMAPA